MSPAKKSVLFTGLTLIGAALLGSILFLSGCMTIGHPFFYHPDSIPYEQEIEGAAAITDLYVDSSSGNRLHAQIVRTTNPNPRGLVVFFHGNTSNLRRTGSFYDWVVAEGYDFFHFDYSGYGESTGEPNPRNLYLDGLATLDLALAQRRNPGDRLILIGASLGGAVLLRSLADWENREETFLLITDGTFDSYRAVGQASLSGSVIGWPFQWLAPLTLSDDYAPRPHLPNRPTTIPYLVIHSREDRVVPFRFGEQIYAASPEPKWFWPVPEAGHTMAFEPEYPQNRQALLEFLEALDSGTAEAFAFPGAEAYASP